MIKYKKLVRDKIPSIIKADGGKCKYHVAKKDEYAVKLDEKLLEEVEEFLASPCAEEIADVLEVIEAIARLEGIGLDDIKTAKQKKRIERGGFKNRIVLDEATKQIIERNGSHVTLNMGNTETLHKDFKTSGQK